MLWILITLQFKPEELSDLYTQQQTCRFVLMLILLELFSIFGHTKFIINFNKVGLHYKISTMVAFCPYTPPQTPLGELTTLLQTL